MQPVQQRHLIFLYMTGEEVRVCMGGGGGVPVNRHPRAHGDPTPPLLPLLLQLSDRLTWPGKMLQ